MKELKGTEKQVAWAEEIRNSMIKLINKNIEREEFSIECRTKHDLENSTELTNNTVEYINMTNKLTSEYKNLIAKLENKEDVKYFIENKNVANFINRVEENYKQHFGLR